MDMGYPDEIATYQLGNSIQNDQIKEGPVHHSDAAIAYQPSYKWDQNGQT